MADIVFFPYTFEFILSIHVLQVQRVLQEHTKQGEVILLVYRGGQYWHCSAVVLGVQSALFSTSVH